LRLTYYKIKENIITINERKKIYRTIGSENKEHKKDMKI